MNPGQLDRRIEIQQMTETRDAGGGSKQTWSYFCQLWAKKDQAPGAEQVNADRRESINTVTWTTRYSSAVTTKMRIVDGDDIYNIEGIAEIVRRRLMRLITKQTT